MVRIRNKRPTRHELAMFELEMIQITILQAVFEELRKINEIIRENHLPGETP